MGTSRAIVILAAGNGRRMSSDKTKVMTIIGGKPLLGHVIEKSQALHPQQLLIVDPAAIVAYFPTVRGPISWLSAPINA